MKRRAVVLVVFACCLVLAPAPGVETRQAAAGDGIERLLKRLEQVLQGGLVEAYLDLLSSAADRDYARSVAAALLLPDTTRVVIRERDRGPLSGSLPGNGYRLMLEVFTERGNRARIATWRLDVRRVGDEPDDEWRIAGQQLLTALDGLNRLSLNPTRQFRAHNLVLRSEDLEIRIGDGQVFTADTDEGPTALVLMGQAGTDFTFRPAPETEREQVRIYCGSDAVEGRYEEAFVRISPGDLENHVSMADLVPEPVDPILFRRADTLFKEEVPKSFNLDLADMSREIWSMSPRSGDMLAEIRTRRFQTLTYVKSSADAEDISLFDRRRRRNIATYPSKARVAEQGRFFDEDALTDFDVTDYDIDASLDPERQWIEGRATLTLRTKTESLGALTIRLAETLTVRSVFSAELGRLLSLRVRNQNAVVVSLPGMTPKGSLLTLVMSYGGLLPPVVPDREAQFPTGAEIQPDAMTFPGEPSLLYTTRSYWYPQSPVTDYATARMRITVPPGYAVLASGDPAEGSPEVPAVGASETYSFAATQPVRYLACLVSRFKQVKTASIDLRAAVGAEAGGVSDDGLPVPRAGVYYDRLSLSVDTNPRLQHRGRQLAPVAQEVIRYYASLLGDSPYPSLTIALIERDLPGGHSPAYLSVLNQPLPSSPFTWANDPSAFPNYPDFFIAHEIAHQWWGQAVGWRSYHEQWLSEGLAQYFAALYAQKSRGENTFTDLLRRMARWGKDQSAAGPISLGYRLGHIQGDSRIFRAVVYNKSAVVLHMLRRLVGDAPFFRSLRRFYMASRFKKAGTDDLRRAFEAETGQDLTRFFEGWIHSSAIPSVRVSQRVEGDGPGRVVVIHFEQVGQVFDLPLTVTLQYANGSSREVPVALRDRVTEARVPLERELKGVDVNRDGLSLVEIVKE